MRILCTFAALWISLSAFSNSYRGKISSVEDQKQSPLAYANIGIIGKSLGTVSDESGHFVLSFEPGNYSSDSIRISYIGYQSVTIAVSDFIKRPSLEFVLQPSAKVLRTVTVTNLKLKEKVFGYPKLRTKRISIGFSSNQKGNQLGILMKMKKRALLKKLILNVNVCTYDSVFFRVNVYSVGKKKEFTNVLDRPIYVTQPMKGVNSIEVDLSEYEILVKGNTLVAIEYIKDYGKGDILFPGGFGGSSYLTLASADRWEKWVMKFGMGVVAMVEE